MESPESVRVWISKPSTNGWDQEWCGSLLFWGNATEESQSVVVLYSGNAITVQRVCKLTAVHVETSPN